MKPLSQGRVLVRLAIFAGTVWLHSCVSSGSVTITEPVHTLVLRCQENGGGYWQSRLALLSIPDWHDGVYDYGLTTAHSVTGKNNCIVYDNQGNFRPVLEARTAKNYGSGDPYFQLSDWAVLKIERIDTLRVSRYSLNDSVEYPETISTAYIPRGRGVFENTQPCHVEIHHIPVPPDGESKRYPTHDCSTLGGQSGTPLTIMAGNSEQLLYGVLTGRTFLWREDTDQPPRWFGSFIPIDPGLSVEIMEQIKLL